LCGEYAVLEGAPAIVAAVDRRVSVTWSDDSESMPPEVEATLELARAQCGPLPPSLKLDVSALHQDRIKLGLGSSAAAAAATAAAAFATSGHDISDPSVVQRVFDCAFAGHASIAPQGSGVDVAASTYGGCLRFTRIEGRIEARAASAPSGLAIRLVWTGHAARTSDLLSRVQALRVRDPDTYRARMKRLTELASEFAGAFEAGSASDVVAGAASYCVAMAELGQAAGAPIVEETLGLAASLAERCAGSAKPCGAGGGDVAVAFFVDADAAKRFELACIREGLHPIDVAWGALGVQAH
jgi:phosphomevalonate kinase